MKFDDRGTRINLFASEEDANRFAARQALFSIEGTVGQKGEAHRYAFGWLVKDAVGAWWDADGFIGGGWQPDQKELYVKYHGQYRRNVQ